MAMVVLTAATFPTARANEAVVAESARAAITNSTIRG